MTAQLKRVGRTFTGAVWGDWDDWRVCEYLGSGNYLLRGKSNGFRTCPWKDV